jgi:hypothetical protein
MAGTNPFLTAYDGVFNCLFGGANNALADMVKLGNRVSYGTAIDKDRNPTHNNVVTSDIPEIQLLDEGGSLNLHSNSSGLSYQQNIALYLATGDWRYGKYASMLNWYTVVNMAQWRTTLGGLTWNNKPFIKNIKMDTAIQIGSVNPQRSNAPAGWSAIWRMTLDLRIDNVDVIYIES